MNFSNPYSRDLGVFTWAALQAAYPNGGGALAALPTGVRAFVGDLGHEFVPNTAKTRWTPSGGSFVLRSNGGSVANPIASMTGVTSGIFSIPGGMPTIPSALLDQGDSIFVRGRVFKTGANATANMVVRLGTAGTASDSDIYSVAFDNTSTRVISLDGVIHVYSSSVVGAGAATNRGTDAIQTSIGATDYTTNINTAAAMYVHFAIGSANTSDTFSLLGYSISVVPKC